MDTLDDYTQGSENPPVEDYTALQRHAFHELFHLAEETVRPIEERLEADLQSDRADIEERFIQDKREIELYRQTQLEDAQSSLDTYAQTVRNEYDRQVERIEEDARQQRDTANKTADEHLKRFENERKERLLEAEFVEEGGLERVHQGQRQAQDTLEQQQGHLAEIREQMVDYLRRYRQAEPGTETMPPPDTESASNLKEVYKQQEEEVERQLGLLRRILSARLLEGWHPFAWGALLIGAAITVSMAYGPSSMSKPVLGALAGGVGLVVTMGFLLLLRQRAKVVCARVGTAFVNAWQQAEATARLCHQQTLDQLAKEAARIKASKENETQKVEQAYQQARTQILEAQEHSLTTIEQNRKKTLKQQMKRHNQAVAQAQQEFQARKTDLDQQYQQDLAGFQQQYDQSMDAAQTRYQADRTRLGTRWDQGLASLTSLLRETQDRERSLQSSWNLIPPTEDAENSASFALVRFGSLHMNLGLLADGVRDRCGPDLAGRDSLEVPAVLAFPDHCSLLLQCTREGRERALQTLRATMVRIFTTLPSGQARFTILDPVGLGESFAGFMHAGDYLEALVGGRIWTEATQIQQQLEDLTAHMENVIQKYLRNEFETIEEYNAQAGELAEPYRFLVIADFPTNFTEEAARRLSSILHSGPRCGVHTLITLDERQEWPAGIDLEDLLAHSIVLNYEDGRFVWQDSIMRQFPLTLDTPPDEATLTQLMHAVGRAGAESARVEVPFKAITPDDTKFWSLDSRKGLRVPLGRTGATRLQHLDLGKGMAQHLLIAGKTGSGKSTLLHVMITNLALWYRPEEVELYLIDFKKGVEFKGYVTHHLPHARAVAIESDREFGLSILQRLDREMSRRGNLFRQAGVQDIAGYRDNVGTTLPRAILIVDEFQVFFGEDDKLAQDASILLEQLVRQGRAFGIHVILGSQTLGGAYGLARSTMGQMAVRIALQCSEADSQLILDDDNVAARLLSRPGEAIYNDAGGQVVGNSPFQTAWLPDTTRDGYLATIEERLDEDKRSAFSMIVFEGSAPADIRDNPQLTACLSHPGQQAQTPRVWLGDPVAIKEPTAAVLRRQSGANLLMVGQRDDLALRLMGAGMVGLAAQMAPSAARFVVLDGSPADAAQTDLLTQVSEVLPHDSHLIAWRDVPTAILDLANLADRRIEADERAGQAVYLLVYGLQRYRMLRRSEDAFGLSMDAEATPQVDARFADLLRDGPAVGIHVLAWADTLATVERTLDRQTVREFDYRVLFQMSAADSSNLIDSPAGNQLGFHRALLYSEEQGGGEKFRPYAALDNAWLNSLRFE